MKSNIRLDLEIHRG